MADLHHTIIEFFERRMEDHTAVESFQRQDFDDEHIYLIRRRRFGDEIRVWLSDAYMFTEMDFDNRPTIIRAKDYIVIAKPEGGGGIASSLSAETKIGVGKLAIFMGALSIKQTWKYVPPTDEERERRRKMSK